MAPFREWIYLQMAKRELLTSYWRRCLKSHWPKGGCSKVSDHFKLWNIILMRAMVPVFLSKEQHGVIFTRTSSRCEPFCFLAYETMISCFTKWIFLCRSHIPLICARQVYALNEWIGRSARGQPFQSRWVMSFHFRNMAFVPWFGMFTLSKLIIYISLKINPCLKYIGAWSSLN